MITRREIGKMGKKSVVVYFMTLFDYRGYLEPNEMFYKFGKLVVAVFYLLSCRYNFFSKIPKKKILRVFKYKILRALCGTNRDE